MKITFHGGAKSVTGANYLLDAGSAKGGEIKILVDCGLFQGFKYAEDLNYEKFNYQPQEINYLFITHSHTDHAGRIPKLYKEGFRGKVFAAEPALEMMKIALPDNLSLMEDEAGRDFHDPLFTQEDLDGILSLSQGFKYGQRIELGGENRAVFQDAGHILGSSIVGIDFGGEKIFFSGDLGNPPTPLLNKPEFPLDASYIVVESAYGARIHEDRTKRKEILINAIKETMANDGTLMIPSFAMERTQELLYELNNLVNDKKIPEIPIFVDSPLATKLTEVYKKYSDYFNKEAVYLIESGDDIFRFPGLRHTVTSQESKSINEIKGPKVIIAGSGMSMGGRILHHEKRYLSDPRSMILFIGYQVEGSLGRKIFDGAKEVKIFGETVPVRCRVKAIGGYSAHADQPMIIDWIAKGAEAGKLKKVFVVQGEENSSLVLAEKIKQELKIESTVPSLGDSFEL